MSGLPPERREVLWCGAGLRTLLAPGEEQVLLEARLEGAEPAAAPSSIGRALADLSAGATLERTLLVVGDAPLPKAWIDTLPPHVECLRVPTDAEPPEGAGLTALGIAPAASGRWTRVDALATVRGSTAAEVGLWIGLDGNALGEADLTLERREVGPGHVDYLLRDLPAEGGRLELRLEPGDALDLDDHARLDLPRRPRIRVAVDPALASLTAVLEADDAVQLVDGSGQVDVRVSPAGADPSGPALVVAPSTEQEEAILVTHRRGRDSTEVLRRALGELGLDRIDAADLADRAGRPIAAGAGPGQERRIGLWDELLDPERYGFVESRAFPVFVARSIRWLAEQEPLVPYLAADRPLPRTLASRVEDSTGSPVPAAAGEFAVDGGPAHAVSLLDPDTSAPPQRAAALGVPSPESAGWNPVTWILLLALVLACVEWGLYRRGRMP